MLSMDDTKLVVIKTTSSIPELGGISGPVTTPTELPIKKILQLVNGHRLVYEVNPDNYKEQVKLTISNIRDVNFKKAPVAAKVEAPKKQDAKKEEAVKVPEIKAEAPKGDFEKKN